MPNLNEKWQVMTIGYKIMGKARIYDSVFSQWISCKFFVVNQSSSIRAYELEEVNEIGPSKILECFICDPDPISIWKGLCILK